MAEPTLSMTADDDLPRTIRRERDAKAAREREARERDARERLSMAPVPATPSFERAAATYSFPSAAAGTITDIDVPFGKLMAFFIKAVFAAIPALLILTALLWLFGHGLQAFFPDLVKLKILIYMPK